MNIVEAYDNALKHRKHAKFNVRFGLTLIVLLAVFYAVTIASKGWDPEYLWGLIGFVMLGTQAALRYREYKFWDREITDFNKALSTYGRRVRP